jgi:glycosyltransferase involved in cell wall biosynthesis
VWMGAEEAAPEGVEVAGVAGPYPRLDLVDAPRAVREHRLDAVLFAGNTGPVRPLAVPTVLTVHDLLFFDGPMPRKLRPLVGHAYERWIVPRALRAASAVTTVSDTSGAAIRARVRGVEPVVIPHGIESSAAQGTPVVAGAVVAFAGRDARKRTDLVLDAYELLPAPRPPLVLLASAGMPAAVEARLAAWGSSLGAVHVTGHLPRADVDATIAASLALLYPSDNEGFGVPVLEGMASGAPVITGLAPATREVAGDAGLLIDPARPAASIAEHITAMGDPAARAAAVAAGTVRASAFTWSAAGERYAQVIERLLEGAA